jgi:2-enoate reductase
VITYTGVGAWTELADAAHAFGAKIFVQLSAGFGRTAHPHILRNTPVSASVLANYWDPKIGCREVTTAEVETLIKAFGAAAVLLVECGVDGFELHGHEGYLFDQFTTALWNRRTDRYGGDLACRLRFPLEVLHEIRKYVGKGFPVQYRFGLKHYIKGLWQGALPGEKYVEAGRDVQEGLSMARMLEEAGFDALHVDAGSYDSWYWAHPPGYHAYGCMVDMAEEVKKAVRIPVISVGRLDHPEVAGRAIARGKADLVAIGRGFLADPFWAKKVEQGQQKRVRPCVGCHDGCMGRLVVGKATSCAVNPASGREKSYAVSPSEQPHQVMIIGGGVAGMEAARVAALRGHRVALYEKSEQLGGHVTEAVVMPFKASEQRLLEWYRQELDALQVAVYLKSEVTPDFVCREKPGTTIVATGSKPIRLNIPGADRHNVLTACDLLTRKPLQSEKMLVVGGGRVGCETALWLAQQGKQVTLAERLDDLLMAGSPVPWMNRKMLLDLLALNQVKVLTGLSLSQVTDSGAVLVDGGSRREMFPADTVILAVGLEPVQDVYRSLQGRLTNLYLIGDARKAWNMMNAIWDAYEVARAL